MTVAAGATGVTRASDEAPPAATSATTAAAAERFRDVVEPILADHCAGCHGNGIKKGNITLDEFASDEALLARDHGWYWRIGGPVDV